MYGYIYKTTINNPESSWHNHYYIGQRKSSTITNDYYYGSGAKISSYIKKHSTKGLEKEILFIAETKEELDRLEVEAVGDLWNTDSLCMNSMPGGGSGTKYSHTPETRKRISETMKRRCADPVVRARLTEISRARRPYSEETKHKISVSNKKTYENPEVRKKVSLANKGRNPLTGLTEEQIRERYAKVVRTREEHFKEGVYKTCQGRHWYTNGIVDTLATECPEGFKPGRTLIRKRKEHL